MAIWTMSCLETCQARCCKVLPRAILTVAASHAKMFKKCPKCSTCSQSNFQMMCHEAPSSATVFNKESCSEPRLSFSAQKRPSTSQHVLAPRRYEPQGCMSTSAQKGRRMTPRTTSTICVEASFDETPRNDERC